MVLSVTARRPVVVAGATASGKSELAMMLAERFDGEIVCCDSVQLYRGFDVGSAKPTAAQRAQFPHHMVDVVDWSHPYDASRYAREALEVIGEISGRGKLPIIVGGTGLYLRALWREGWDDLPSDAKLREQLAALDNDELHRRLAELNPTRAAQIHRHDRYRLQRGLEIALLAPGHGSPGDPAERVNGTRGDYVVILMAVAREVLNERIAQRTALMLDGGLIAEVEKLLGEGCPPSAKPMQSIGYKQVTQFLEGALSRPNLATAIVTATRQYAKRQRTWFHKVAADFYPTLPHLSSTELAAIESALDISE